MASRHIFIGEEDARLRSFSTTSRGGKTVIKLELEVTNSHGLSNLMYQLASFNEVQPAKPRRQPQLRLMPPGGSDAS